MTTTPAVKPKRKAKPLNKILGTFTKTLNDLEVLIISNTHKIDLNATQIERFEASQKKLHTEVAQAESVKGKIKALIEV